MDFKTKFYISVMLTLIIFIVLKNRLSESEMKMLIYMLIEIIMFVSRDKG